MALEHALLVALSEHPGSGLELTRRFERSIGFFWKATHQQIYRVLARMETDGWVSVEPVAQDGRPDRKVYAPSAAGREELSRWLATPMPLEAHRSELAVKLRGAAYGNRRAVLDHLALNLADHATRLAHFRELETQQFPDPETLIPAHRDRWLVLRGGIRLEQFWIDWITECLTAHGFETPTTHEGTPA